MKLVWKLLRQHISWPQLVGFFFANLFDADRSALIRAGIDPEEIALMRDEMQFVLPEGEMQPDH